LHDSARLDEDRDGYMRNKTLRKLRCKTFWRNVLGFQHDCARREERKCCCEKSQKNGL